MPSERADHGRDALAGAPAPTDVARQTAPALREALAAPGLQGRIRALTNWWGSTRVARTLARYGSRNGGLLASGMALTTLLSLTAALTVGWTLFMTVLGSNAQLRTGVIDSVNTVLPGLMATGTSGGLLDPDSLVAAPGLSVTSVVAFLVMAWSAVSLMGSFGSSIRAMFGVVASADNAVVSLARNVLGALGLGLAALASAGLGILVSLFGDWTFRHVGVDPGAGRVLAQVGSVGVSFLVDAGVTVLLVRVVSGVRAPRRDLVRGAVMVAVASAVLRQVGTVAVGSVTGPLLTTATAVVTLVLWINLQVRVVLTVCAWMANPPRALPVPDPDAVHYRERPNFVTMSVPATLEWPHHPITGEVQPATPPAEPADDRAALVPVPVPDAAPPVDEGGAAAPTPGGGGLRRWWRRLRHR